ncbi:MAG: DegV family protein [Tissierellia bacterium]|nr:DegV family protein [Tissierellia bacterium]
MRKIAIVTDTNSGITQKQAEELGVYIVPMPVIIEEKTYYEGIDLDRGKFYEALSKGLNVSTSQPSPADVANLWQRLLMDYDDIVYIPMSSSLSRSYDTAHLLAQEFDNRVHVVDNKRISVHQRQSVLDALELVEKGMSAWEIKDILEEDKYNSSIYITVSTLEYLKKGGRITPAVANIGTILRIKPVLQIQGGLLESFAKARTINMAKKIMIKALKDDVLNRFGCNSDNNEVLLQVAHTDMEEEAENLKEELQNIFPGYSIYVDHLSLSIACHTGPGAIGVGCVKKLKVEYKYSPNT